jgi:hypothetical protein
MTPSAALVTTALPDQITTVASGASAPIQAASEDMCDVCELMLMLKSSYKYVAITAEVFSH